MSTSPLELSFDEILKFMLMHNGKVTNYDLVKHFKVFLTNPDMKYVARGTFKRHVNTLAIIKNQNNEKWLILKKKYMPTNTQEEINSSVIDSTVEVDSNPPLNPIGKPELLPLNQDFNILNSILSSQKENTEELCKSQECKADISCESISKDTTSKVHSENQLDTPDNLEETRQSILNEDVSDLNAKVPSQLKTSRSESMLIDNEQKISVKERKLMFNRMASEGDVLKSHPVGNSSSQSIDEEDRVSLDPKNETIPLDSKQKQWILCAARGEYHSLAKMCKENQKIVKTKDPFTGYTAMHWACKRGDENSVKLLAGAVRSIVNERSNGGYTPLHIAMQFRHENVYKLLVEVYDADPNLRDWSGRKPRQCLVHMDTSLSPGSYRKKESFLRIGSLNVRVKKTTEAVSNFLGVGATRSMAYMPKTGRGSTDRTSDEGDQIHKSWGSADNIQKNEKLMPPPMSNKVKRRGASGRRGLAAHSRSTPSTPDQSRAHIGVNEEGDSDSDSAAGFHAAWRQQRASNCT